MGMYHVRSSNGNTRLGGAKFVDAMVEFCIEKLEKLSIDVNFNDTELSQIRVQCEKAKQELSSKNSAEIIIGNEKISIKIEEFNELIKPYIYKTIESMEQAIDDADVEKDEIDKLILVGGGTYTPLVREMLADFFGRDVDTSINPMEAGML